MVKLCRSAHKVRQVLAAVSTCTAGSWNICKKNEEVLYPSPRDAVLASAGHAAPDRTENGWFSAGSLRIIPVHGEPTGEYFSKTKRPTANTRLKSLFNI